MYITTKIEINKFTESALQELANQLFKNTGRNVSIADLLEQLLQDYAGDKMLDEIEDRICDHEDVDKVDKMLGCSMGFMNRMMSALENANIAARKYRAIKHQVMRFPGNSIDEDGEKLEVLLNELKDTVRKYQVLKMQFIYQNVVEDEYTVDDFDEGVFDEFDELDYEDMEEEDYE